MEQSTWGKIRMPVPVLKKSEISEPERYDVTQEWTSNLENLRDVPSEAETLKRTLTANSLARAELLTWKCLRGFFGTLSQSVLVRRHESHQRIR